MLITNLVILSTILSVILDILSVQKSITLNIPFNDFTFLSTLSIKVSSLLVILISFIINIIKTIRF